MYQVVEFLINLSSCYEELENMNWYLCRYLCM